MNTNKDIEIRPQEGFQMSFASSNVDVVFGGGNLGGGKDMVRLAVIEAFSLTS
jgi:hypothetical protein